MACAKAAAVLAYIHEAPLDLQEAVPQTLIEDTFGLELTAWRHCQTCRTRSVFSQEKEGFKLNPGNVLDKKKLANIWA